LTTKKAIKHPKTVAVEVRSIENVDLLWIKIDPSGMIYIRERYARRWLEFPISRLYLLAAADAASKNVRE